MAPRPTPPAERFWKFVDASGDCWEWIGQHQPGSGYGQFSIVAKKKVYSHRYAYELLVGPIPTGFTIDHLCRNRNCVNPDHLEPVTRAENVRRGASPGARATRSNKCMAGHFLTPGNTYVRPDTGHRQCKTCRQIRQEVSNGKRSVL